MPFINSWWDLSHGSLCPGWSSPNMEQFICVKLKRADGLWFPPKALMKWKTGQWTKLLHMVEVQHRIQVKGRVAVFRSLMNVKWLRALDLRACSGLRPLTLDIGLEIKSTSQETSWYAFGRRHRSATSSRINKRYLQHQLFSPSQNKSVTLLKCHYCSA